MNVKIKFWNGKKKKWEERVYYCVSEIGIESKKGYDDKIEVNGIEIKV